MATEIRADGDALAIPPSANPQSRPAVHEGEIGAALANRIAKGTAAVNASYGTAITVRTNPLSGRPTAARETVRNALVALRCHYIS